MGKGRYLVDASLYDTTRQNIKGDDRYVTATVSANKIVTVEAQKYIYWLQSVFFGSCQLKGNELKKRKM